jgi:hypothetical protein
VSLLGENNEAGENVTSGLASQSNLSLIKGKPKIAEGRISTLPLLYLELGLCETCNKALVAADLTNHAKHFSRAVNVPGMIKKAVQNWCHQYCKRNQSKHSYAMRANASSPISELTSNYIVSGRFKDIAVHADGTAGLCCPYSQQDFLAQGAFTQLHHVNYSRSCLVAASGRPLCSLSCLWSTSGIHRWQHASHTSARCNAP